MAYYPQLDGTTEQVNQEIESYLSIYCTSHPENWLDTIHTMEFTHNNWRHADRPKTPFELMLGESQFCSHLRIQNSQQLKKRWRHWEEALAAHELARTRMIKSNFIPFKQGNKVWLDTRNLKTNHYKKIGPKQEGPFEITKVIGLVTYQLKLPKTWKIHNVFHAVLLQQYKVTKVYGANFLRPPPELIEGEVYEVEIQKVRMGVLILCEMERISYLQSIMGTRRSIFRWCGYVDTLQRVPPNLKNMHLAFIFHHGLSNSYNCFGLLPCRNQVEVWHHVQTNLGNLWSTRRHKRS